MNALFGFTPPGTSLFSLFVAAETPKETYKGDPAPIEHAKAVALQARLEALGAETVPAETRPGTITRKAFAASSRRKSKPTTLPVVLTAGDSTLGEWKGTLGEKDKQQAIRFAVERAERLGIDLSFASVDSLHEAVNGRPQRDISVETRIVTFRSGRRAVRAIGVTFTRGLHGHVYKDRGVTVLVPHHDFDPAAAPVQLSDSEEENSSVFAQQAFT